jgi:transposase
MEFRELSDFEWGIIKPLLPPRFRVGRPRADDRRIINGILYVLTTGCRWMDMPLEYGSYKTRLLGGGLNAGRMREYGIGYSRH